jgi:hypothetical protein
MVLALGGRRSAALAEANRRQYTLVHKDAENKGAESLELVQIAEAAPSGSPRSRHVVETGTLDA